MKRLLVPTDFSPCAYKALEYAVHLARKMNAEILLLHVCSLFHNKNEDHKALYSEYNDHVLKDVYAKLRALKQKIKEQEDINVNIKLADGKVIPTIVQAAMDFRCDLIVAGTFGSSQLYNKVFGSNASALINKSSIPVLTIPVSNSWQQPQTILLAIKDTEDLDRVSDAFTLARLLKAKVTLAVYTPDYLEYDEFLEDDLQLAVMEKKLKGLYSDVALDKVHLSGDDFQQEMKEYLERNNVGLFAMVTHKRTFAQHIINSSLTRQMSYYTTVPLLSLPSHQMAVS